MLSSWPRSLEVVDQPADLGVGVLQEGGERLLEPRGQPPLVVREGVPRLHARVAGRQFGVRRQQAQLDLAGEPPLAGDVPPSSNRPRYLSGSSAGAWWGACMAPKAR